jgi:hypothetical protein
MFGVVPLQKSHSRRVSPHCHVLIAAGDPSSLVIADALEICSHSSIAHCVGTNNASSISQLVRKHGRLEGLWKTHHHFHLALEAVPGVAALFRAEFHRPVLYNRSF